MKTTNRKENKLTKQQSYFLAEVAKLARKSVVSVQRDKRKGLLNVVYVGRSPRVTHQELVKYLGSDPFMK